MIGFTTSTLRRVDLGQPRVDDICIEDIGSGLSKICRFSGQVSRFHSVGWHSMMVATLVEKPLQLAALLHDGSEAYLGDVSRNLKHSPYMAGYRVLELAWTIAIEERFNLMPEMPAYRQYYKQRIKEADDMVAVWERCVLRYGREWVDPQCEVAQAVSTQYIADYGPNFWKLGRSLPVYHLPEQSSHTEAAFLGTFYNLGGRA